MSTTLSRLDMALSRARSARQQFECSALPLHAMSHVPVVIVGAGPVGLAAALDLRRHGINCVVLEKHGGVGNGSRAICWAKRSLEICDRLGVAAPMLAKGVTWNVGKVFAGAVAEPLYTFDLAPADAQKFPAFINLQQYYVEEYLLDALAQGDSPVRWQHTVKAIATHHDGVAVTVTTPQGQYQLRCDYLIAADGAHSTVRDLMGLAFEGRTFEDNFLIADVRMRAAFSAERRFYFNAPFNEGRTALMHQQPDDIWRLDFQLGWDIDRQAALEEAQVTRRVQALLGPGQKFEYEWDSLYTFQCRRLQKFVHGRVIFAGDAAHLVSPFGARGGNGGLQDVDNLVWKLAWVLQNSASPSLLASYDQERVYAADENLRHSTQSTDFMTPKTEQEIAFRDAALDLARQHPFARRLVNSGRLSLPCQLRQSVLTTPDRDDFDSTLQPGDACLDAPLVASGAARWLLESLGGDFICLYFVGEQTPAALSAGLPRAVRLVAVSRDFRADACQDSAGVLAARYDARPGTLYLIRPDQHIAARWRQFDARAVAAAMARATGH
jgi:3-(3-hydroxy-phenyl)propionate hydroxylase